LKASLRTCQTVSCHQYPGTLRLCPWCEMELQTGVRLFGQRIFPSSPAGVVDVGALWASIMAVKDPGPDPSLPSERSPKLPAGLKLPNAAFRKFRRILSCGLILSGLIACNALTKGNRAAGTLLLYGLAVAVWPRVSAKERSDAHLAYTNASAEWQRAMLRWKQEASRTRFAESFKTFEVARAGFAGLPNERRQRFVHLEGQRESRQRHRYLDRFRIDRGNIHGIGPGRSSMLVSYGIETAADVDAQKILKIPGFGDALTSELVNWRKGHERKFRFNSSEPLDPRDVDELERELRAREQSLLTTLRQGPIILAQLSREITAARPRLMPTMEKAWEALKIAEVQRDAL